MEITTKLIKSDLEGNYLDPEECPGFRAFKRACKQLPWYKRIFISYQWDTSSSLNRQWESFTSRNKPIYMTSMDHSNIGDTIIFKKK